MLADAYRNSSEIIYDSRKSARKYHLNLLMLETGKLF